MGRQLLSSELTQVVLTYCEDIGTPVAKSIIGMIESRDWDGISRMAVDPNVYSRPVDYFRDATCVALLKKFAPLPTSWDRRKVALGNAKASELECYRTNERLSRFVDWKCGHPQLSSADQRIRHFVELARKRIEKWIGARPPSDLMGRFGPGGTFAVSGNRCTVPEKMLHAPTLTHQAFAYLFPWVSTQWGGYVVASGGQPRFVRGNKFTTVPKDCSKDRSIASEPDLNIFFQLALGKVLRTRLARSTGIDLRTASELHVQVAREASRTGSHATLDLSNASDTVAYNLVKLLLPPKWFEVLEDLRSPYTLLKARDASLWHDGCGQGEHWVRLEKFSSMGNGFTFELETIIFLALSSTASSLACKKGVIGKDVFVFGDDIIVREDAVAAVKSVLRFFGFSLNTSKSFSGSSPFRESCGGDFFKGVNVRPFYLKDDLHGPEDFIAFANGLRRNHQRLAAAGDIPSLRAWFRVLDRIPTRIRSCRGPTSLGDLVIHDDKERWSIRARNCGQRRFVRVYRPCRSSIVPYRLFDDRIVLACATYGCGSGLPPGARWDPRLAGVTPRDGVLSYKVGWAALLE